MVDSERAKKRLRENSIGRVNSTSSDDSEFGRWRRIRRRMSDYAKNLGLKRGDLDSEE